MDAETRKWVIRALIMFCVVAVVGIVVVAMQAGGAAAQHAQMCRQLASENISAPGCS